LNYNTTIHIANIFFFFFATGIKKIVNWHEC